MIYQNDICDQVKTLSIQYEKYTIGKYALIFHRSETKEYVTLTQIHSQIVMIVHISWTCDIEYIVHGPEINNQ